MNPQLHLSFAYEVKWNRFVAYVAADMFNDQANFQAPAEIQQDLLPPIVVIYGGQEALSICVGYGRDFDEPPITEFYAIWG